VPGSPLSGSLPGDPPAQNKPQKMVPVVPLVTAKKPAPREIDESVPDSSRSGSLPGNSPAQNEPKKRAPAVPLVAPKSTPYEIGDWVPGSSLSDSPSVDPPPQNEPKKLAPVVPLVPKSAPTGSPSDDRASGAINGADDSSSFVPRSSPRTFQEPRELLNVAQRKSVQLRIPSAIRRLEVEDPNICEPLQSAPGEVAIVGKQQGETRLAVWVAGETEPNYWCVRVSGEAEPLSARDDAALRRMVAELYPQSRVRLVMTDEKIYVQGQAKDRQEAIQILSFVGNIRLIPIVDQLIVSSR
jgi:hypothetical protein